MKQFEKFNNILKENKSAEQQAFECTLGEIGSKYNLEEEMENNKDYLYKKFKATLNWLNSEVMKDY